MKLPPSVRQVELAPEFPVFEISHPCCEAKVALHGAQVISWKPRDEDEVLYLSEQAFYEEGRAIRGGIPVCWPWFSQHPTEADAPSHGLVRKQAWTLLSAEEDGDDVTLIFGIDQGIWSAEIMVKMGLELEVSLTSKNENEIPIVISGALHTYFAVGDIEQIRVVGLEGSEYLDKVTGEAEKQQSGSLTFSGELDRVYNSSTRVLLVDDLSGRTILIEKSGSPSTVVWNPWAEKAPLLPDMKSDDYRKFCCVETAIANDRAEFLMPGATHVLMTRISIEE